MDFNDVIVHVFYKPVREFYDLERLWEHAPRVQLPEPLRSQALGLQQRDRRALSGTIARAAADHSSSPSIAAALSAVGYLLHLNPDPVTVQLHVDERVARAAAARAARRVPRRRRA